jgi:hypothetical protein
MKKTKRFLLVVWGDVEPELLGPFKTQEERDRKAREIRTDEGDEHGLFPIDAAGKVEVGSYSGGFFNKEEDPDHGQN